jgi:hypothetical protein
MNMMITTSSTDPDDGPGWCLGSPPSGPHWTDGPRIRQPRFTGPPMCPACHRRHRDRLKDRP